MHFPQAEGFFNRLPGDGKHDVYVQGNAVIVVSYSCYRMQFIVKEDQNHSEHDKCHPPEKPGRRPSNTGFRLLPPSHSSWFLLSVFMTVMA